MSDANWDDDDFEPQPEFKPAIKGKWEGEDEDDVKDNWDDDEDEEEVEPAKAVEVAAVQMKKKKTLKEKIAEKEEQKKLDLEQKLEKKRLGDEGSELTPKQVLEEKKRVQKIQEQSDLELALDALGLDKTAPTNAGEIDLFDPKTKEDFAKFGGLLSTKILKYESSPHYEAFLESLFRDLVLGIEAESIRKITSSLTALYNEKLKVSRSKSKKKPTKATLNTGKANRADGLEDNDDYGDYDDFM